MRQAWMKFNSFTRGVRAALTVAVCMMMVGIVAAFFGMPGFTLLGVIGGLCVAFLALATSI